MNKNVGIKLCLEFENAADLKEFSDTIKQFIPDFLEMPITVDSDNTLSMTTVAYDHQVSTFLQASAIMGEGFERMLTGKSLLDSIGNIQSFRDEISRLVQFHPDEYLGKTVIQNVGGGHSIYGRRLRYDDIRDIRGFTSKDVKPPEAFYITLKGDILDILEI